MVQEAPARGRPPDPALSTQAKQRSKNHYGHVRIYGPEVVTSKGGMSRMEVAGKTVFLPKPRGFCAGVIRAIDIVALALEKFGRPVYVRKEIVHNSFVAEELAAQGAVCVENLYEVR